MYSFDYHVQMQITMPLTCQFKVTSCKTSLKTVRNTDLLDTLCKDLFINMAIHTLINIS